MKNLTIAATVILAGTIAAGTGAGAQTANGDKADPVKVIPSITRWSSRTRACVSYASPMDAERSR
jgi:hypothetical protein